MPRFPADHVVDFPNADHRDADLTSGGCGNPTCRCPGLMTFPSP